VAQVAVKAAHENRYIRTPTSRERRKMNFMESVKTCFSKYADFNGRASRPEYWWFFLFIVLGSIVASALGDVLHLIFAVGTLLPSVAAAGCRPHDTGRSGWLQLIVLIPIIGWLILIYFLAQPGEGENRFGAPAAVS
jgi:uncharacterized membrane protein YhaH (DUF805 family)